MNAKLTDKAYVFYDCDVIASISEHAADGMSSQFFRGWNPMSFVQIILCPFDPNKGPRNSSSAQLLRLRTERSKSEYEADGRSTDLENANRLGDI